MAERNFKVGASIEVKYQAANGESGATIEMEIVKPDKSIVEGGPTIMTEIGNSGRYFADFVPDTDGEWSVLVQKSDGSGKMVKAFSVGDWDVHELGAKIVVTEGKIDDQNTNLSVVHTKVDEVKTNTDKLPTIETDVANIKSSLGSPPMIA